MLLASGRVLEYIFFFPEKATKSTTVLSIPVHKLKSQQANRNHLLV